jgi:hypothetical protein
VPARAPFWPKGDRTRSPVDYSGRETRCSGRGAHMTGVFEPPNEGYVKVPLEEGEQELLRKTAGLIQAQTNSVGGILVLTNRRLLFRPLDVNKAAAFLKEGLDFFPNGYAEVGKVASKVIDAVDDAIRSKAGGIGHKAIAGVRTGRGATLIRPPTLYIDTSAGHTVEFGVLRGIGEPNISPRNKPHRDEMVQAIQSVLSAT